MDYDAGNLAKIAALEAQVRIFAEELVSKHGFSQDYTLDFANDLGTKMVVITAGYPPSITLSRTFILSCWEKVLELGDASYHKKQLAFLPVKTVLRRALDKAPKMVKSLSHNSIKSTTAIALDKEDSRKWKILNIRSSPANRIANKYFEVSYGIIIKETISGTEKTELITDLKELASTVERMKVQLSNSILDDEARMDLLEMMEASKEPELTKIGISVTDTEVRISNEY